MKLDFKNSQGNRKKNSSVNNQSPISQCYTGYLKNEESCSGQISHTHIQTLNFLSEVILL